MCSRVFCSTVRGVHILYCISPVSVPALTSPRCQLTYNPKRPVAASVYTVKVYEIDSLAVETTASLDRHRHWLAGLGIGHCYVMFCHLRLLAVKVSLSERQPRWYLAISTWLISVSAVCFWEAGSGSNQAGGRTHSCGWRRFTGLWLRGRGGGCDR